MISIEELIKNFNKRFKEISEKDLLTKEDEIFFKDTIVLINGPLNYDFVNILKTHGIEDKLHNFLDELNNKLENMISVEVILDKGMIYTEDKFKLLQKSEIKNTFSYIEEILDLKNSKENYDLIRLYFLQDSFLRQFALGKHLEIELI